jgi:hypothetical protein
MSYAYITTAGPQKRISLNAETGGNWQRPIDSILACGGGWSFGLIIVDSYCKYPEEHSPL